MSSFRASVDESVMTKHSEMQLHQPGNGHVMSTAHVKALFITTIMELYLGDIFNHVPQSGCGTETSNGPMFLRCALSSSMACFSVATET